MFKKSLLATVAVLACTAFGAAHAMSVPQITTGEIKFSLDNYDSATVMYGNAPGVVCLTVAACDAAAGAPAPGSVGTAGNASSDTMGIFSVSNISNITTSETLFVKGAAQGYITGIFGNLQDAAVSVSCDLFGCSTTAGSVGGFFELWYNTSDYDATLGPLVAAGKDLNAGLYPGISGGTLLLSGVFAPGAVLAGPNIFSYLTGYNNGTFGGNGQGFLDLTGGAWFDYFNTSALNNANGGTNDLFLTNTFDDVNGAASSLGWTVKSVGQVTGFAVPEPTSVSLVALALLGAGVASRRRKAA
jgi:hypothetical protein